MKYRRLGNSGLKISEIGLGSWLTYGKSVNNQTAYDCIHKAYELGINFLIRQMLMRTGEQRKF